jgi:hypothetical protein
MRRRRDLLGALLAAAVLMLVCVSLPLATHAVEPTAAPQGSRWANVEHKIKDAVYSATNPMLWDVADPGEPNPPSSPGAPKASEQHQLSPESLLDKAKESIAAAKEAAAALKPQEHHRATDVAHNAISVFRAAEEQLRKWARAVTMHMVRGCC